MVENNQLLILLRGLPGSGKTFMAKQLSENNTYPYFSIDDYFTDDKGNYHFDFSKNYLAYKQCETNTRKALLAGAKKVIVHNPFVLAWEIDPYFTIAKECQSSIAVLTVENFHEGKNSHSVTPEQLEKMATKYMVKLY
jgi:predicted kinase